MNRRLQLAVLAPLLLLTACATINASKAPDADLSKFKSFYVVQKQGDQRGIEKLIAARLVAMGHPATSGEAASSPNPVDGLVTYQDRWMWDITMYMIRLNVQVRDGKTGAIVANAEAMRPSLQRKSPDGMVEEVLGELLK